MTTARAIAVADIAATPWRNGGGSTRELLARPDASHWHLRISVADIAADGPFSAFPGVQRWFTLLAGEGVVLDFAGTPTSLRPGDAPLAFDGVAAPGCRLLGGPVRDLNLMFRHGSGGMAEASPATRWPAPAGASAGLFARQAGYWRNGADQHPLAAMSLLWFDAAPAGNWQFEPDSTASSTPGPVGWWLFHRASPNPS